MEEEVKKVKGKPPEFVNRNEGTAVWINQDKNGNEYLSIDVMGGKINLKAFRNLPKPVEEVKGLQKGRWNTQA